MAKGAQQQVGMEKSELRLHVKLARRAPVHIAFALGGDGKAIVMMDKRKQPRAILKDLKEQAAEARNHRFGHMVFDEADPKLVRIVVDKAASGMARKLVLAFKGTGVRKVELTTEDGQSFDAAANEEDEDDQEEDESRAGGAGHGHGREDRHARRGDGDAASAAGEGGRDGAGDPDQGGDQAGAQAQTQEETRDQGRDQAQGQGRDQGPRHDGRRIARDLTGLVKRMVAVIANDPSQKSALAELAVDAQASLKRGDLAEASAAADILREALKAASAGSANSAGGRKGKDADAAGKAAAQAAQRSRKSRAVWVATLGKVDAEIKKLSKVILSMEHGGQFGDDLEQRFLESIDPVLSTLNHELADILARAEKAGSKDEADEALGQARAKIGAYQEFVTSDPTIRELDRNPFVPMRIATVLSASLKAMSAAVR